VIQIFRSFVDTEIRPGNAIGGGNLDNASGLNAVIHIHDEKVQTLPVKDSGVLATFNTPEEFQQIKLIC